MVFKSRDETGKTNFRKVLKTHKIKVNIDIPMRVLGVRYVSYEPL